MKPWIKNEGKVSTPPTQEQVDIHLSQPNIRHPDGIWLNENPNRWDWLHQSCEILEWRLHD